MPRKNNRETFKPLDLSPATVSQTRIPKPRVPGDFQESLIRMDRDGARSQRIAEEQSGIDWTVCLVPGCGQATAHWNEARRLPVARDHETNLPLCNDHAVTVWQQVQRFRRLPDIVETAEQMSTRHKQEAGIKRPTRSLSGRPGELYFVRINNLVKVGWTQTLPRRLKEYGAGAVLLCHYPGTVEDETKLHHRLTPARAKGREWYHDGDLISRHVRDALAEHGPPTAKAEWTVPKNPVTLRYVSDN